MVCQGTKIAGLVARDEHFALFARIGEVGAGDDLAFGPRPAPAKLADPQGDDGKYFLVTAKKTGKRDGYDSLQCPRRARMSPICKF